jgi:hypothetical protein
MTNVYDGPPDARQSDDIAMLTSRFRPRYRALSDAEKALHDEIKDRAAALENLFEQVVAASHREGALAMTKLEEAVMWAIKALSA